MNTPLRLLIIEDSKDDALLIVRDIERAGYELTYERVETEGAVRAALDGKSWDIVISDYSMPQFTGTDALKLLRERDQDTPFIFVSGTIGEDVGVEAMRAGAQDYVTKGNLRRLVPAIERELREVAVRRERRAGEARFRRVIESAMIGILFWDPQGRILDANDEFLKIVRYTREDLEAGRIDWRTMTPPGYEAADANALQEFAATGTCTPFEKEYIRKDGTRVPIIVGGALLDDADHPAVAFIVDISKRKQAENALRTSEARYRVLFDQHPHPLWVFDRETLRFLEVNEAAVRQYGYSRDEFLHMTIEAIRPPSEIPALRDSLRQQHVGLHHAGVWRHQKKDGSIIDVETTAHDVNLFDRPTRLVAAVDITERRRAEAALQSRERQQAAVAKLGEQAISTTDLTALFAAAVSLVSKTLDVEYSKVLELQPDGEWLLLRAGVGWREGTVGHARVGTGAESQAGYTIRQNRPIVSEDLQHETRFSGTDLLHSHGVLSSVTVTIPGKQRPFGVLGAHANRFRTFTQDDIYFLQAVAHILGTTIDRDRTEISLRQSQRLESVGRLAGGVAHDFNNVLTAIFGYTDLIVEETPPESPIRSDLREIRKAAERASGLTRQLLAFSRQQVLQPVVLSLNEVVENLDKMLQRLIGADVALRGSLGTGLGNVRADPGQIEQVIVNLVVNARDAMPAGGKLTIETANAELSEQYADAHQPVIPGRYVLLAVSDTGSGMTPEVKARLFEPFFTTKEPGRGTGLGLATVYGIVKQSGGYIWVYSEPGHGATFKIYLPRVDEATLARVSSEETGIVTGTETILLAEDDDMLRPLAKALLEKHGYTVLDAASADDALTLLAGHAGQLQLLITDVVMPGASGRELARRVADVSPGTRVLYVSGYTDDAIVHHGMLEPGLNFLQKPFTSATLAKKVRDVLDAS